jgi:hypothetical protein
VFAKTSDAASDVVERLAKHLILSVPVYSDQRRAFVCFLDTQDVLRHVVNVVIAEIEGRALAKNNEEKAALLMLDGPVQKSNPLPQLSALLDATQEKKTTKSIEQIFGGRQYKVANIQIDLKRNVYVPLSCSTSLFCALELFVTKGVRRLAIVADKHAPQLDKQEQEQEQQLLGICTRTDLIDVFVAHMPLFAEIAALPIGKLFKPKVRLVHAHAPADQTV